MIRTGIGYDVHRLVPERKLILGGVEIPFEKGLLGHSDADVLLHAITDALLGAAGLGDLGEYFSDQDPQYKDADSRKFLKDVDTKIKAQGYQILNIDTVLIAQAPKLAPYKSQMKSNIAETLQLSPDQVNVKATTEEGMGFTGTGEGMAAWATVTIEMKNDA